MTREEAINILYGIQADNLNLDNLHTKDKYDALTIAIKALEQEPFDIEPYCKEHFCVMVDKDVWEKAEKALKQEPILDKIKSEIKALPRYGSMSNRYLAVYVDIYEVLKIIDKYRGEVDCHSCKTEHDCYECKKYAESEES